MNYIKNFSTVKLKSKTLNALKVMLAVVLAFSVFLTGLGKTDLAFAFGETQNISGDGTQCTVTYFVNGKVSKTFAEPTWRCADGSEAFCVNQHKIFKAGLHTSQNPTNYMSSDTLNKITLAKQKFLFEDMKQTTNYATNYSVAQCIIWSILRDEAGTAPANETYAVTNSNINISNLYTQFNNWYNENGQQYEPVNAAVWSSGANNQPVFTAKGYQLRVGNIDLQKASSNPDITNNNKCYSLSGAQYGVYSNAECTSEVATLTTDGNGYAKVENIKVGTYWVKEKSAPQGYALDTNSYQVTVKPNETIRVNGSTVQDRPQNDPVGILLGKYDGQRTYNGDKNLPQGSATLAGAEFTVKYYDGQYSTPDEAENSGNATRTWVYRTDENGLVRPDIDLPISGDSVYRDNYGEITFPLGSYVVFESKAPVGYLINNDKFIRNVTSNNSDLENVNTYNTPQIKESVKRGDMKKGL